MNNKTAYQLLIYIAENLNISSGFLSPQQEATVEVIGLLNEIARLRGITLNENGEEFNQIMETRARVVETS